MERLEQGIEVWTEVLSTALEPVALAAASAALLAGVVLGINVVFRRWLTAGQMALLWGLVLIRLAIPLAPESSFSLTTMFNRATAAIERFTNPEEPVLIPAEPAAPAAGDAAVVQDLAVSDPFPGADLAVGASAEVEADPMWMTMLGVLIQGIIVVFPFVAAGIIGWTAVVHRRLCRFVARQIPSEEQRLIRVLDEARSLAGFQRPVRLYVMTDQQTPAVMGLWSPAILLPFEAAELSDDRLRLLLLHELAHVRRGDVIVNWLLMILKAAHWWNPVFWLASRRFRALREQACDAFAVAKSEYGGSIRDYGEMLLDFVAAGQGRSRWLVSVPSSLLGISASRGTSAMRGRLRALRSATWRPSVSQRGLFAATALALAIAGWTEATEVQRPAADPWFPAVSGTWDANVPPEDSGGFATAEIDITAALDRHIALGLTREVAEKSLLTIIEPMVRAARRGSGSRDDVKLSPGDVQIERNKLKLTAGQATVDEIARLMEIWGKTGFRQISMECRIVKVDADLASQLGVGWKSVGQSKRPETLVRPMRLGDQSFVTASAAVEHFIPVCVASVTKLQALQFVKNAQNNRKSTIQFAPKVTVLNGSTAQLSTEVSQPFVVGAHETDDGQLKPTVSTVEEGLRLTLRPLQNDGRTQTNLAGGLELSVISDVTTAAARMKSGRDVNVQIPRVNRIRVEVDSVVPDGETLLIGCLPSYERREFVYLMVTPRWLEEVDDLGREIVTK